MNKMIETNPSFKIISLNGAFIYALPMSHAITSKSFSAAIKNASPILYLCTTLEYFRETGASVLPTFATNMVF